MSLIKFIKDLILKTQNNQVVWSRHPEIPNAFCFVYSTENHELQVIIDKYNAYYNNALSDCFNLSIISLDRKKVYQEMVRCKNTEGPFSEEFDDLENLYEIIANKYEQSLSNLKSLGLSELTRVG